MAEYLIRKLELFTRLSADDKAVLRRIGAHSVRHATTHEDIIHEGDAPEYVNLVLEGFACRYKVLEDGRRQIMGLFVPGDLCDVHVFVLKYMDHSIAALSPLRYAQIPRDEMLALFDSNARITRALWWHTLVDHAIVREYTVNLGQRSGLERVAHLICELFVRMRAVGLVKDNACDFPFTQLDLSDALGITPVHTNRMLQELRRSGLLTLRQRRLEIHNFERLRDMSLFNANYLHLDHEGREFDANEKDA